jgi:MtrB/PioB family decaheme-associated outer membrane protein
MRALWLCLAFLAASAAFGADAAPAGEEPSTFHIRMIDFGLQGPELDTNSSRFREYRSLPSGPVLRSLHFAGNAPFWYELRAKDALQDTARYLARLEPGSFQIEADYQKLTHRFGNDARSLFLEYPRSLFVIADTIQSANQSAIETQFGKSKPGVNYAFLSKLVAPQLEAGPRFDLRLTRDRGRLEMGFTPKDDPLDVKVSYFLERRYGNRAAGTAFGFGNVTETGEPIEYRTHDIVASAEYQRSWGLVRGGVRYNVFQNKYLTQTFDNPFRITDSTDASAYSSPGSGSIGGAAVGRVSLPPENEALTGNLGVLVKLPSKTRITGDVSLSRWTQDSPFMPFSTNTAITTPVIATDLAALPARSLNGKIDVSSLSLSVTSRPAEKLFLNARYRRYDLDNKTPRIEFEHGYVRFDAVWEDIPRISVPYGYLNERALASASYDLGRANVEAGYRFDAWHRTFREVEKTTEGFVFGALRYKPVEWALLRASAEHGARDFDDHYDLGHAEHASFLDAGPETNQAGLRRVDLAKRDTDRLVGEVQLTPWGKATLIVSYRLGNEDFKDLELGLMKTRSHGFNVDADYSPSDRWSLFGFAARETFETSQKGRQSGATPSANPADNWTSEVEDVVDTFGGGLTWIVVKEKVDLKLNGSYQRVEGHNALSSPPGGTPDVAFDIPAFDDTKLVSFGADLGYNATRALRLAFGGWREVYTLRDSATVGLLNYLPSGLFLNANDSDYKAYVLYGSASYMW